MTRSGEAPLSWRAEVDEDDVKRLPKSVCCPKCRKKLIAVKKNPVTRRVDIEVRLTKPPEIVNLELRLGRMECPACGEKIPVDLALFGAPPSPRH